jgi:hypothetical protein
MRYEQSGVSIWYATPDAPAPEGDVLASRSGRATGITVTVGVQPIATRNTVEVRYRVNGGGELRSRALLARTDVRTNAQYFVASLPEFRVGDTVEYGAVCNCAGRQTPGPELAGKLGSSFRVMPVAAPSVADAALPIRPIPPWPSYQPPKIPDHFDETALAAALALRLAGTPADDSGASMANGQAVIWVDRGDEVLVHLDSIRTQIRDGLLLVSVDLETDQTGRTPLVTAFALGNATDTAGLVAVTSDLPQGNGILASRWGKTLREALWSSLLGISLDHANERSVAPIGFSASAGAIQFHAGVAPSALGPSSTRARV